LGKVPTDARVVEALRPLEKTIRSWTKEPRPAQKSRSPDRFSHQTGAGAGQLSQSNIDTATLGGSSALLVVLLALPVGRLSKYQIDPNRPAGDACEERGYLQFADGVPEHWARSLFVRPAG
jgi:hypothetical protein